MLCKTHFTADCKSLPFVFASFAHDRQMVDGMRDCWELVWTESKEYRSYSVGWGFFALVAGFSKLSVACVCALGRFGVEGLPRCSPKFQPWGCLFLNKEQGMRTKGARAGSFAFETRIDIKLWK